MKKLEIIIQPEKLEALKAILDASNVSGIMISNIMGYGNQKGHKQFYRGAEYSVNLLPKIKVETVVEPEVAEPENKYAKSCNGKVVSGNRTGIPFFIIFSNTRSEDFGTNKCTDTADHMDCCGTCKIVESHLSEPSTAPDPVAGYRVNKNTDCCTIQ